MCISGVQPSDRVLLLSFGSAAAPVAGLGAPLGLNVRCCPGAPCPGDPASTQARTGNSSFGPARHLRRLGVASTGLLRATVCVPPPNPAICRCTCAPLLRGWAGTRSSADSRLTGRVLARRRSVVPVCSCLGRCSLPAWPRKQSPYPACGCEWASPWCDVDPCGPLIHTTILAGACCRPAPRVVFFYQRTPRRCPGYPGRPWQRACVWVVGLLPPASLA